MSSAFHSATNPASGGRDALLLGGLLVLLALGLASLAAATGWSDIRLQIGKLGIAQLTALLGLSLVNYLFRALRWHVFSRQLGLPTSLGQNLRHFVGGFAMTVTPGRLGELIRMRWLRRETAWPFERTAPLALIDRASDLAAMALILALSLILSAGGIRYGVPVAVLALAAAVIVTRPRLLSGIATLGYRSSGLFPRLMARVRRAARSLAAFSRPQTLLLAIGLGGIGWLAEGFAFHLLLVWLGADIGLWTAMMIFVFSTLAGGLTGAPGGLGGAEAAMVTLLMIEGVPLDVALPATAIIRLTTLWFAIALGLVVFPYAERASLKVSDDLEN